MRKLILLVLIFFNSLFACSICTVNSPRVDVQLNIKANEDIIENVEVNWTFPEKFSEELFGLYDINLDKKLDNKELSLIEESIVSYIAPINYLAFISYGKTKKQKSNKHLVKDVKTFYENKKLKFKYTLLIGYKIKKDFDFFIQINDDAEYFLIHLENHKHNFDIPYKYDMSSDRTSVTYTITDEKLPTSNSIEIKEEKALEEVNIEQNTKENLEEEKTSFLEEYTLKIKENLLKIEQEKSKTALVLLLIASFFYGVIHALGPGHGKALAFSYFTAQKSSYIQAFSISMATAFIHILGAFVLVVVSVFILQSILNSFIEDSISYLTSLCAVLIMILSLYILYKKLKSKSCACNTCCSSHNPSNRKKQDLFFVLTAGLIPCPGTVLLFVYAFILETYFSVVLASIAISLGMGIVIFASSFLGLSVNKLSNKSHKLTNTLEIIAPIFMFILGVLLLIGINI